jgi:hypothetical protein
MRRIYDDHVRLAHALEHGDIRDLTVQMPTPTANVRIAFGLLVLAPHLQDAHAIAAAEVPVLKPQVEGGERDERHDCPPA